MRFMFIAFALALAACAQPQPVAQTVSWQEACGHLEPTPGMSYVEKRAVSNAMIECLDQAIAHNAAVMQNMPIVVAPDPAPQTARIIPQPGGTALVVPNSSLYQYNPSTGYYWSPGVTCAGGVCR